MMVYNSLLEKIRGNKNGQVRRVLIRRAFLSEVVLGLMSSVGFLPNIHLVLSRVKPDDFSAKSPGNTFCPPGNFFSPHT